MVPLLNNGIVKTALERPVRAEGVWLALSRGA
jgi:hypothetical protein